MSLPAFALVFRRLGTLAFLMGMLSIKADASPGSEALSVRSEVAPGPYFVGQGFELRFRGDRGRPAAEDRSAADRRRAHLGDWYRGETDHHEPASARWSPTKTCS